MSIGFLSAFPEEAEVLFPPGTHFRVLSKRRSGFEMFLDTIPTYNFDDFVSD